MFLIPGPGEGAQDTMDIEHPHSFWRYKEKKISQEEYYVLCVCRFPKGGYK